MARVAIVTGGTRGIGEAISVALKDMGMKVAANYAGNDERAREFTERTGIPAYKWDVADFDACQEGVAQGRGRARAGRRAGQQCRHHPRHDDEADGPPEVAGGDRHQPRRLLQHGQGGVRRHAGARLRADRQHRLDQRPGRPVRPGQLCRRQVGHPRLHQGAGAGRRAQRRHRQRHRAGLYRHRHGRRGAARKCSARSSRKIPVNRLGKAEEIARGVAFLVDENAGFVTGSTLSINGGQHMY